MNETGKPNRPFLREVAARNLLSFGPEGLRLELMPLNVLMGSNGSGKSNFFEILALLHAAPTELASPVRTGAGTPPSITSPRPTRMPRILNMSRC